MRLEQIRTKLEDLYNNYMVNRTVFNGLFNLLRTSRKKMLRYKMLKLVEKIKKLKELAKDLDNKLLNAIESKLKNGNLTNEEYLEHIYTLFNENMLDINNWKDKRREIELKKRSGHLSQEDVEALFILNKSIKLANDINKDLMSLFVELTKDKNYSKSEYPKKEEMIEGYTCNKTAPSKGLQIG